MPYLEQQVADDEDPLHNEALQVSLDVSPEVYEDVRKRTEQALADRMVMVNPDEKEEEKIRKIIASRYFENLRLTISDTTACVKSVLRNREETLN